MYLYKEEVCGNFLWLIGSELKKKKTRIFIFCPLFYLGLLFVLLYFELQAEPILSICNLIDLRQNLNILSLIYIFLFTLNILQSIL